MHHLDLGGPAGAPVVLCVHGLGGSALNRGLLGPLLAGTHRVLAVDLFGHGRSGVPARPCFDALTADLRLLDRFVREVVGEPVTLLGHSMGGVLTVLQATTAPATVAETRDRAARSDAAASQAEQWAALLGTMALLARPRTWMRTVAAVSVPTLWLQGADDPLAKADGARAVAATRPDWAFEIRPGMGHLLALEGPAWTAERILAGHGPATR